MLLKISEISRYTQRARASTGLACSLRGRAVDCELSRYTARLAPPSSYHSRLLSFTEFHSRFAKRQPLLSRRVIVFTRSKEKAYITIPHGGTLRKASGSNDLFLDPLKVCQPIVSILRFVGRERAGFDIYRAQRRPKGAGKMAWNRPRHTVSLFLGKKENSSPAPLIIVYEPLTAPLSSAGIPLNEISLEFLLSTIGDIASGRVVK